MDDWKSWLKWWSEIGLHAWADLSTEDPGVEADIPDWMYSLAQKHLSTGARAVFVNELRSIDGKKTGLTAIALLDNQGHVTRLNIRDFDGILQTIGIVTARDKKLMLEKISLPIDGGVVQASGSL